MKMILGEVLGSKFSNVSLKNYTKTLKKVEDKEDYDGAKQAVKESSEANKDLYEDDLIKIDEAIDIDTLVTALPSIYRFGLGMISDFYTNGDPIQEDNESIQSGEEDDNEDDEDEEDDGEYVMKPPVALTRDSALEVMRDEHSKYINDHQNFS